jgi:hypothetical protein
MADKNNIWGRAKKMLLIVNYDSMDGVKKQREAIKALGLNVHECNIIAVVPTKKEKNMLGEISSVTFCSDQEINIIGRFKNPEAVKVLGEYYDIMTVVGDYSSKLSKVLKRSKVGTVVGVNSNVDFLTIKLSSEASEPEHLLNFVKQTLEKIN